jgi:hypothetical protein
MSWRSFSQGQPLLWGGAYHEPAQFAVAAGMKRNYLTRVAIAPRQAMPKMGITAN